jgi:hypothetical protein
MSKHLLLAACLGASFASTAFAAPELLGAWSTTLPGQGGMTQVTESFDADGHFVTVRREPNGTMMRVWGDYRSVAVSPTAVRVESRLQGWAPRQICAQAPGFPVRCNAFTPPEPQAAVLDFVSPDAFRQEGLVVQRDRHPGLLAQQVSDRLVLAAPAPVQAPLAGGGGGSGGGSRYVTPTDPSAGNHGEIQQRRICSINGGSLVVVSGRLTCVN